MEVQYRGNHGSPASSSIYIYRDLGYGFHSDPCTSISIYARRYPYRCPGNYSLPCSIYCYFYKGILYIHWDIGSSPAVTLYAILYEQVLNHKGLIYVYDILVVGIVGRGEDPGVSMVYIYIVYQQKGKQSAVQIQLLPIAINIYYYETGNIYRGRQAIGFYNIYGSIGWTGIRLLYIYTILSESGQHRKEPTGMSTQMQLYQYPMPAAMEYIIISQNMVVYRQGGHHE